MESPHLDALTAPAKLKTTYSPTHLPYVLAHPSEAYAADCPTLARVISVQGEAVGSVWVQEQLTVVFGLSANRDTAMADSLHFAAETLAAAFAPFKLTELMLFFARYRAGRYDKSYSTFDPRRIGLAFHKEFLPERAGEQGIVERHRQQEEIEQRRFTPPEGFTSLSWYQHLKQLAAKGDKEAAAALRPPKA